MTIRKIVKLCNVGRFANFSAKSDDSFEKLTLIYGPNGHGKTTLTGVLRSVATGDPAYIAERATLGATGAPTAIVLSESGQKIFSDGAWNSTCVDLEIFDSTFVNDNVYTGEHVGPEHRKNLYQVIVGNSAVSVAREIDDFDSQSRKLSATVSALEYELRGLIQAPFSLEDFVALEPEPDLDTKIRDCTIKLGAVRKQRDVLVRPQLDEIRLPAFPSRIIDVLTASIKQLSDLTESRIRQHIQAHLDHRGESWLQQGLDYSKKSSRCPFCDQDTSSAEIIRLYADYFSTAYRDHLIDIQSAGNQLEQSFGDRAIAAARKCVMENDAKIQTWSDQVDLSYARLSFDALEATWVHLLELLRAAVKAKLANPSDGLPVDTALSAAIRDFDEGLQSVSLHNGRIRRANDEVANQKRLAASTSAEALEGQLRRLRNMQIRQTAEVQKLVASLVASKGQKRSLESTKKEKRAALGEIAKNVLEKYESSINRLLKIFGASFSVVGTKPSFAGGKASSTYQISINDIPLELGDSNTPRGKPCFRTALSTGDKSTLALAFFLARLEHDEALEKKCVVFDDPLSSFDCFRTACTQQEIANIARKSAQVIVLSHDAFFLKRIFDHGPRDGTGCLQVIRLGETCTLRPWRIVDYFLKQAHQEYFILRTYLEDGAPAFPDLTSVARAIRPYLEGHFRSIFPDAFVTNDSFGEMLGKIRNSSPADPLSAAKTRLDELDNLNEYARAFHHSTSTPRPSDDELRPYVQRAVSFVQGR